jgi:hypothetical protein
MRCASHDSDIFYRPSNLNFGKTTGGTVPLSFSSWTYEKRSWMSRRNTETELPYEKCYRDSDEIPFFV